MRGKRISEMRQDDGREQAGVTRTGIKPLKCEVLKHQVFIKKVGRGRETKGGQERGREGGRSICGQ